MAVEEIFSRRQDRLDRDAGAASRLNREATRRLENAIARTARKVDADDTLTMRRAPGTPLQRVERPIESNNWSADHNRQMNWPAVNPYND